MKLLIYTHTYIYIFKIYFIESARIGRGAEAEREGGRERSRLRIEALH